MNLLLENDILSLSKQITDGDIMAQKRLEDMTKEELVAHVKAQNKKQNESKWKKMTVLTLTEGDILETEYLPKYDCANVSQLVKKIVRGELILFENTDQNNLKL